jgi:hypothetical protein
MVKKARQLPHFLYLAPSIKALNTCVTMRLSVRQVLVPNWHDCSIVDKAASGYGASDAPNVTRI